MKWANRMLAAFVILSIVGIMRGMLPPREVSHMLEGLSHPLAEEIGRMYYMEGWSEDERWYLDLEKRHGLEKMEEALLVLAVVPNEQIAGGALGILARKGGSRAVTLLSTIATDDLSPVRENAQSALKKIRERGIRSDGQANKSEKVAR